MFKTNGNDVTDVTSYKTLNEHAPQGVRPMSLKLHMITLRIPFTKGCPKASLTKSTPKVRTAKAAIHSVSYRDTNTVNAFTF